MIEEGQDLGSLPIFTRLDGYPVTTEGVQDAYETEAKPGVHKVWWVDPQSNRQVQFNISGTHHDVSRPLGMVFAVEEKQLWGASITGKSPIQTTNAQK